MSANKNKGKNHSKPKQEQNFLDGLVLVEGETEKNSAPIKELNDTLAAVKKQVLTEQLNIPAVINDATIIHEPQPKVETTSKETVQDKPMYIKEDIITEITEALSSIWYIGSAVLFDSIRKNNADADVNLAVKFTGFYNKETMLVGNSMVELMESTLDKVREKYPNKINAVVLSKEVDNFYQGSGFFEIGTVLFDRQEVDITLKSDKNPSMHKIQYENIYALGSEYDRGFKTYCILNHVDNVYKVICFKGEKVLFIGDFLYNRNVCRLKIQERYTSAIDDANETNTIKYIFKNKRYLLHNHNA